ncbi:hypothetical protein [Psychroserpens sp.]|uniref:hypothetical protein n=1 Tax=Psychroserpens sp. TaxID=2020870 RepID=UPI002B2779B3|nr:hypothetical protein [Psychroserpens sp.]
MSKSIDHNSFLVENGNNNIIKTGKFNDFKELKSFVEKIKKEKESLLHRTSIEDNNDFTILEDRDIYIYDDGLTTSYTMAIQKENQSTFSFSNLVVKFSNNDTTTAFILNYIPSQDYLNNYVNDPQIPFQGEVNYESIDYDGSLDDLNARYTCNSITVTYCNYGGEVHAAGENCTPSFMFDVTYDICYDSNNGQPLNESIDPPAGPNNGGGGSNSNPTIPLPTDTCEDSNTGNIGLIGGNGNCYSSEMLALSDELEEILDGIDYEYDSSLTDYEVISFNTVDEFEEFHDSIFDDVETEDSETSNDDGISKTKTFDHIFDIGMFSYTIKVEVETTIPSANSCDCMVVEDVTTILIGNTTLVEWEQLGNHTTEVSSDGSELTVYTRGTMTVGVKIDGYPFRTTYLVTFVQVFDYSTGYVIEYYLIKE